MIRYNQLELQALSALMLEMNEGLVKTDVRLRKNQYFGPGQVAQQYLHNLRRGKRRPRPEEIELDEDTPTIDLSRANLYGKIPPEVWKAAQDSYYGGWFDVIYHGIYEGKSYG